MCNKIKIAILGFGTVGKGIFEIIEKQETEFTKMLNVKTIFNRLTNKEKIDTLKKNILNSNSNIILTDDVNNIINDDEIKIVCECLGGIDFPYEIIKKCLDKGKFVVTANKKMLANKYSLLINENYKNKIFYEASCAGGIHLFSSIKDLMMIDNITKVEGIINGTTNYILTKMKNDNLDFDSALKEAQKLGYAEADPTDDIEGFDAKYKIFIIHNYIWGNTINLNDIKCEGITKIKKEDIQKANKENKTIKLIATTTKNSASVSPILIDNFNYIANVNENINCVSIDSTNLGVSSYIGKGAGSLPTAHAMVLDIKQIVEMIK